MTCWTRVLSLTLGLVLAASGVASARCRVTLYLDNSFDRLVWNNSLDAECPGSIHSAPWGNWGVESPIQGREDGYQFPGWHSSDGKQMWNSCTGHPDYDAPDTSYYNYYSYTEQISASPLGNKTHGVGEADVPFVLVCSSLNNHVITVEAHDIELWELDPFDSDEFLGRIWYPEQSVTLSCTGSHESSTCYDETSWSPPSSTADLIYAATRVRAAGQWTKN